jgi:hypothetical protein
MDQAMTESSDLISLEMLRQLLSIQTGLSDGLKAQQAKVRARMVEMVYQNLPEEADQLARTTRPIESLSDEEILERIGQSLERNQVRSGQPAGGETLADAVRQRDAQIEALRGLVSQLQTEKERLEQQVIQMNHRLEATQQILNQSQAAQSNNQPLDTGSPEWFHAWKGARGFENEANIIRLMGDTGLSRRPALVDQAKKIYQISLSTFHYVLDRLIERGLVKKDGVDGQKREEMAAPNEEKTLHIDILLLTDLGTDAYRLLTGKEPIEAEVSIFTHHSSPEHAILILEAADVLTSEGYQVIQRDARNVVLPNGASVRPDLVVKNQEGNLLFIEVERDTYKGAARIEKWRNLHAATGGKLYIICDTHACLCSVRNESNQVLEGMAYTRWLTDLRSLRGNPARNVPPRRNARDGSMWIEKKKTE